MPENVYLKRVTPQKDRSEKFMDRRLIDGRNTRALSPTLDTIIGDDLNEERLPGIEASLRPSQCLRQLSPEEIGTDDLDFSSPSFAGMRGVFAKICHTIRCQATIFNLTARASNLGLYIGHL